MDAQPATMDDMDTTKDTPTTTGATAGLSGLWVSLRDELRARRAAHAAYAKMMRELDAYHTRAEIEDLLAAVDRSESPEAEQMRRILHSKLAHAARGSFIAA